MDAVLWGTGLGIVDGTVFSLMREAYNAWIKLQRPNATESTNTRMWVNLGGAAGLGGILMPIIYLWAAYSVGSLMEVHIYRCIVSVLCALLVGTFAFNDTINGFRALGVFFSILGLALVLTSTAWGNDLKTS